MTDSVSFSAIPILEFVDLLILAGRSGIGGEAKTFETDLAPILEPKFEDVVYSSLIKQTENPKYIYFLLFINDVTQICRFSDPLPPLSH